MMLICADTVAQQQSLVPLDDFEATVPLLPAGISRDAPELFGNYAHLWTFDNDTSVIQYYGDFAMHLGERRLRSQDAVIWMQKSVWEDSDYYHFEVFLSRQAWVRDSAGTVTTGPMLFVTFNSVKPAAVEADITTDVSSADTTLFQEASKIRHLVGSGRGPVRGPGDIEVIDFDKQMVPKQPKVRPLVRHRANQEEINEKEGIITAIGDVYISQGLLDSGTFLEIRADAAVLFLIKRESSEQERDKGPSEKSDVSPTAPFPSEESKEEISEPSDTFDLGEGLQTAVAGTYLRGDVVLTRGERMIRASELYYDFEHDRALILDAVMRAMVPDRNVPIYVRARHVRQLSTTEYMAQGAAISTSEFHTPHVHIGASRIHLTDVTPRDEAGQIIGLEAGQYRMHDATLNLEGLPIAYWPYTAGDFRRSETSIRSIRMAYSDDYGATLQSKWYLFNLMGLQEPEGTEGILRLDYFSERGPGVGMDIDYERENYYGLFRGYYIHDTGEDNLGPYRDGSLDTENRGRITLRHRQYLPKDWELTLEGSYISDPNFLEEYFNAEFEEGKEQETLIYLKKQRDNWAFTALTQWRVLDFLTQTEHFPDLGFHWIGEPLGGIANYFNESHIGFARYKPDNRRFIDLGIDKRVLDNTGESDITFRGDTRNEVALPFKIANGQVNIVPYAVGRAGYWDSSPFEGSVDRMFGSIGMRAGSQLWRVFESMKSKLLDVSGIRHIIKPEMTAWFSGSNRESLRLHPFDEGIEDIDDFYGTSLALRQRWQTKRGAPGDLRQVDWITLDIELNLFGDAPRDMLPIGRFYESRPENSMAKSHIRTDFMYRISDTTAILSDGNFDLNDGNMDLLNLSYAVERTPRFSYFVGYRRIGDTDSNLLGAGMNYEINTKHRVAVRSYYDLERGQTEQFDITIVRKFPRWYLALTFAMDRIEDDFGVGLSMWPEGAPQAAIGTRRYTGLSTSTGIRPED
ncbi:MAG: LPS assembly protein LptD [Planctomycetota bacterium]|nr:MAG: LPS assembly protein LptD [Planctomycetota bacterium]